MVGKKYSASLTGNPFLFFETRETARLMLNEGDPDKVLAEIMESNLFQYQTTKSVQKRFRAIYKRLIVLDSSLLEILADGSVQEAKVVNLLSIIQIDRLFQEFIWETVAERIRTPNRKLNKKDFDYFFEYKREVNPEIKPWTDKTIKKLSQVYIQILYQSGLIDDRKNKVIHEFLITNEFKQKLALSFPREFIDCITG